MPLTFPAHAAAILPLHRAAPRLHPTALVVGSCAPDVAYVLGAYGWFSHTPLGTVLFCLPAGLCLFFWAELLLLPAARLALPNVCGVQLSAWAESRGLPRRAESRGLALLSLWLGALTHVLWDGLTHGTRWPANVLYPGVFVTWGEVRMGLANALQLASSLLGTGVVVVFLWRRRQTGAPPTSARGWLRFSGWALATCGGGALGVWLRLRSGHPPFNALWWGFWTFVTGALVANTVASAVLRWIASRRG